VDVVDVEVDVPVDDVYETAVDVDVSVSVKVATLSTERGGGGGGGVPHALSPSVRQINNTCFERFMAESNSVPDNGDNIKKESPRNYNPKR
jgi:hypothetical protein